MPTLTVETGEGLSTANSYASLDYANGYFSDKGEADWDGTTDELTSALYRAFQSLEQLYGPKYLGTINPTSKQAALFPRFLFQDNNGRLINGNAVPECIRQAQCEIALLCVQGLDIFPQCSTTQNVASQTVKLGELSTSTQYARKVEGETFNGFRKVDLLLAPVLTGKRSAPTRLGL
jgi:hypothetical protein